VDGGGRFVKTVPVTYLPDSPPVFSAEGLVYLPPASSVFPNTFARAIWDGSVPYIEIVSPSGVVQRDIPLALPPGETYVTGVAYLPSGQFLVSSGDQNIWAVGLDGSLLYGPAAVPEAWDVEGLTALRDGRVVAADYTAGVLFSLTSGLVRDPSGD